jgi:hypothetical protein
MIVATYRADAHDEGYPRSSESDLDPRPSLGESLDDADLVTSDEHRVAPERRRHDGPTDVNDDDVDAESVR